MTARRNRPQELVERALSLSRADGCAVVVAERSSADLRWARNALTTNGTARGRAVTVIATVAGGQGTAAGVVSGSAVTADDVEPLVRAAEEAARGAGPADDARPLVTGVPHSPAFEDPPAETSAAVFDAFAPALGESFARARAEGRELYGYARHQTVTSYLGTSTGLRLRHDQPMGRVELNAKDVRDPRSAWLSRATDAFADVDPRLLDAELARRLAWAARGRSELPAGRYPTLLPPTAVADLLCYQQLRADARDAAEGRTVFGRPGGGGGSGGDGRDGGGPGGPTRVSGRTRVGEKLSGLPLTLRSDPSAPGLECAPFVLTDGADTRLSVFDSGLPLGATDWIRDGVLERLTAGRHTAELTGLPVAPYTDNLILEAGGTRSLEEMVAASGHDGPELLLTSLWYIREVDPASLLVTGLTRDGVLLVRDGEVVGEANNFRFNESPVDLLSRAVEAGRTERTVPRDLAKDCPRAAMPALRVPDFHMSSVSRGV
ncbi:metallopeptidase TldD-related protein [Streptomyces huiliensis]|uniref:metallopeptidase TldD-related protein n=1 Tax=Streptomyces huiliensis TaxID=2876027 RepID=UPI001CC1525E|nr:metallopeptidase TldD-related protein [Streptomyces huiliensis]MBZ4321687.1 TldD/PmbA family protein [Streptomyces huiliensis]